MSLCTQVYTGVCVYRNTRRVILGVCIYASPVVAWRFRRLKWTPLAETTSRGAIGSQPTISALSAKLTSDYTVCTEAGTRGVGNEAMVLKRTNEQMTHAWNWWRTKDGARAMPDFHPIRGVMHLQQGLIWSSRDA
jgi:hypothetical protein